jgi:hypothetical protein
VNYHGDPSLHSFRGTADADATARCDRAWSTEVYTTVATNAIAQNRANFPEEMPMHYAVNEVLVATSEGRTTGYRHECPYIGRVVVDSGTAALTRAMKDSYCPQREARDS